MPRPRPTRAPPPRPLLPPSLSPLPLLRQIIALQLTFYLSATLLTVLATAVSGYGFELSMVFASPRWVRFDTVQGWMFAGVWVGVVVVCILAQTLILGRSKLVLDFVLTQYTLHALVTWGNLGWGTWPWEWTSGVGGGWEWWALQVGCVLMGVGGGRWACGWWEMRPIKVGRRPVDEEMGLGAEGGEVEMVPLVRGDPEGDDGGGRGGGR